MGYDQAGARNNVMHLPLFFKLDQLPCLMIGGGKVAARKVDVLLATSCALTVIAPAVDDRIREAVHNGRIRWRPRTYEQGDCKGYRLVIAATPYEEVNRAISSEAQELGIPVNVVDAPDLCTVIFGAVWKEGPLTVCVGTGGAAPFMAGPIRDRVAAAAEGMGIWVETAARFRTAVRKAVPDSAQREHLYHRFALHAQTGTPRNPPESDILADWLDWLERTGP